MVCRTFLFNRPLLFNLLIHGLLIRSAHRAIPSIFGSYALPLFLGDTSQVFGLEFLHPLSDFATMCTLCTFWNRAETVYLLPDKWKIDLSDNGLTALVRVTAHQKSSLGGYDYDETAFLPLQYGHQPGGSPVRGWHHSCHRLHRRGGRVRQHPGTASRTGLATYITSPWNIPSLCWVEKSNIIFHLVAITVD